MTTSSPAIMWGTTTAAFRTAGAAVSTALAAVGLVKTADTGQIDWTTVNWPGSLNTDAGYEIWRFNDSLQATVPVYLKMTWGEGSSSGFNRLTVAVGTGTNGAGTLTGLTGTLFSVVDLAGSDTVIPQRLFGDGGSLAFLFAATAGGTYSTYALVLVIDRTRNSDGTANGDGLYACYGSGSSYSNVRSKIWNFVGGSVQGVISAAPAYPLNYGYSSAQYGGSVALMPHMVVVPPLQAPALACLTYWPADLPRFRPVTVTHLGSSHTYLPLGSLASGFDQYTSSSYVTSLAIRWE